VLIKQALTTNLGQSLPKSLYPWYVSSTSFSQQSEGKEVTLANNHEEEEEEEEEEPRGQSSQGNHSKRTLGASFLHMYHMIITLLKKEMQQT